MQLTFSEIAKILGTASNNVAPIRQVLTDSRDLIFPDATIFACIRTSVGDGHKYIPELYAKGVRHFIVDALPDNHRRCFPAAYFIEVKDVMESLRTLAVAMRRKLDEKGMEVIGITGSRGKTVVKEILNRILRPALRVGRSPRSYNSQLGVPLSIFDLPDSSDVAILEAGVSKAGEMDALEAMIKPTVGIFTSLTDEHSQGFASMRQKADEKALLFRDSKAVYYPADEPMIADALAAEAPKARLIPVEMPSEGGNKARMGALAMAAAKAIAPKADIEMGEMHEVTPRIDVRETLKNCLLVCDAFTTDMRSIADALNFAGKRLTAQRSLTAIVQYPQYDSEECSQSIVDLLKAKGVNRFIGIGFPEPLKERISNALPHAAFADSIGDFLNNYSISDFVDEVILIKADSDNGFEEITSMLETPRHETVMEIDLGAIVQNFNYYRSLLAPGTGLVAMVKAAGYGVGALELAKTMQSQGAAYLAVAVIDEGAELRRAGITMPILVMNPISTNFKALFDNRLEPSVFSLRELDQLLDNAARLGIENYPIHLKLDTGMHRLGFLESDLDELLKRLNSQSRVQVASIFSHLATADCLDQDEYTQSQLDTFERWSSMIISGLPYKPMRHILNTAGIMRYPKYHYDMARLGIGLYGISPIDAERGRLATVARLTTTIISIKEWGPGITIGYGRKGTVTEPHTVIATIPIGYADGLNRHLSNGAAYVVVNGHRCPIIGNICMDQCMIDVTGADAKIGDKVEIFGSDAPIERLSDTLGTIPYEILVAVSTRVKRIYFRQ